MSQWEVWTRQEGTRTKRHYDGKSEARARQIFASWKEDMQQAKTVMLLEDGDRVEEHVAPPKPEPVHSPEMIEDLEIVSRFHGVDATDYTVYGSISRPLSAMHVQIPDAIFMQQTQREQKEAGYYTYIAVPEPLDKEVIEKYELEFISHPATTDK